MWSQKYKDASDDEDSNNDLNQKGENIYFNKYMKYRKNIID